MERVHIPVLCDTVIETLAIKPDGTYIDATFGRGGHSESILEKLGSQGRLLVIDKDLAAIKAAEALNDPRVVIKHGSFAELDEYVAELGWVEQIDGILMDLGVSSPQLDTAERGFSFRLDGPLDMRMDDSKGLSAAEWLETVDIFDLADIIWRFGEERYARRIARAIIAARDIEPIKTTKQLADIIEKVVYKKPGKKIHVATKTFQAIRIFINQELTDLEKGLEHAVDVLSAGGRLVVMSFHSLEDRIVKQFFNEMVQGEQLPRNLPIKPVDVCTPIKLIKIDLKASAEEIEQNPRARSVRLRVAEKVSCD